MLDATIFDSGNNNYLEIVDSYARHCPSHWLFVMRGTLQSFLQGRLLLLYLVAMVVTVLVMIVTGGKCKIVNPNHGASVLVSIMIWDTCQSRRLKDASSGPNPTASRDTIIRPFLVALYH